MSNGQAWREIRNLSSSSPTWIRIRCFCMDPDPVFKFLLIRTRIRFFSGSGSGFSPDSGPKKLQKGL